MKATMRALSFVLCVLSVAGDCANPPPSTVPKQIAAIRRRAGMTHKEYLYYMALTHGFIAWNAPSPSELPLAYTQNHIFDSFTGTTSTPNPASQPYAGRDDITELYATNQSNFLAYSFSTYAQTTIGPDGANFNDFPTAFSMIAYETFVPGVKPASACPGGKADTYPGPVNAYFWVASTSPQTVNNVTFGGAVAAELIKAVGVYNASVHTVVPGFDSRQYFGGATMPTINAVVKLWVCGADASVAAVRAAWKALESKGLGINFDVSFGTFGRTMVVFDVGRGIPFDKTRITKFLEAEL